MNNHLYILYKTTNKVNGKFYIGVHQTNDINDGYIGSGTLLKAAIVKYGIENFHREVLQIFKSKKDAYQKEKELVTEELVKSKDCYNVKEGGRGGFDHIRAANLHFSSKNKKIIHNPLTNEQTKVPLGELKKYLEEGWQLGFKPETIQKMSASGRIKIQSEEQKKKNSEVKKNCILMRNDYTNKIKFIKKDLINDYLNNGWSVFYKKTYKGGKRIYNPLTDEQRCVELANLNDWLNQGWKHGFSPKTRLNMKK
jgi:GIY-YIG catalytic domain